METTLWKFMSSFLWGNALIALEFTNEDSLSHDHVSHRINVWYIYLWLMFNAKCIDTYHYTKHRSYRYMSVSCIPY